jgi:hypothetical protein
MIWGRYRQLLGERFFLLVINSQWCSGKPRAPTRGSGGGRERENWWI